MTNIGTGKRWDQRLFAILWGWIAFQTTLPWLVFFRLTFEGDTYRWATEYFGRSFYSAGLARADFLLIYGLLSANLFLLWQMRKQKMAFVAPMLVVYLGIFAADALFSLVRGDAIIFQGDTLGVKLDLSYPFFLVQFAAVALAVAWWIGVRDIPSGQGPRPMTRVKRNIVTACVVFVPVQLSLLIFGEPHGLTDEIGVILTIVQWIVLAVVFYPGANYRSGPD